MKKRLSLLFSSILVFINNSCQASTSLVDNLKSLGKEDENPAFFPDDAMCYEPAGPLETVANCSVCGTEVYSKFFDELSITSLVRNGFDVEKEYLCYQCLNKLIRQGKISTDMEHGALLDVNSDYIVLNIKHKDDKVYRKVLITNFQNIFVFSKLVDKMVDKKPTSFSEEEAKLYLLMTGKPIKNPLHK